MKRHNFFLPEQITMDLIALSKRSGISMSEHLRNALTQYIREHKKLETKNDQARSD